MALRQTHEKYGFTMDNAYHVIDRIEWFTKKFFAHPNEEEDGWNARIEIVVYKNSDARESKPQEPIDRVGITCLLDMEDTSVSLYKQIYNNIKKDARYSGSEDA